MTTTTTATTATTTSARTLSQTSALHDHIDTTADPCVLGFHRGAIDQTTITTRPPGMIMQQVDEILLVMGVEIQKESRYRYRCVRPQKGVPPGISTGVHSASPSVGGASLPIRVGSPDIMDSPTIEYHPVVSDYGSTQTRTVIYGSPSDDSMGEVRFSVEVTQLVGLKDTYSLDIRRLKGNLKSYSFIYNTIRERAELNQ